MDNRLFTPMFSKLPTCMDYELVLRFRGTAISSHQAMAGLEDLLSESLDDTEELDGHDFGLDEACIFITTPDARLTFRRVRPVLERAGLLPALTAAFRLIDAEDQTTLWPEPARS